MGARRAAAEGGLREAVADRLRLCHVDELRDGAARGFAGRRAGRDRLFVVKHGGRLHAYLDDCPHQPGSAMAWRRDAYLNAGATRIVCSGHGAEFEIESGRCTLGPCLGQSLARVGLEVDADGSVYALGIADTATPDRRGSTTGSG